MSHRPDFKSRFRILKGGKISLVISALVVSGTLSLPANAATTTISTAETSTTYAGINDSLLVTNTGSIDFDDTTIAAPIDITTLGINQTIINNGSIDSTLTTGTTGTASAILISAPGGAGVGIAMWAGSKIENIGTMTATADDGSAHTINMVGSVYGEIINTGTMTATGEVDASAITLENVGLAGASQALTVGSSITNSGTMTATANTGEAKGIYVGGLVYGTISNATGGAITVNGDTSATAIDINNGTDVAIGIGGHILNDGALIATATNNGTASGIKITGDLWANIANSGTITAHGTNDTFAINLIGNMANIGSLTVDLASGGINNSGTMSATSDSASASGIRVYGSQVSGPISNEQGATISATGASSAKAIDIDNGTNIAINILGSITNAGTLEATANGTALGVNVLGAMAGAIDNSGTINVDATEEAYGIYLVSHSTTGSITNSGTISATKNDALDFGSYSIKSSVGGEVTNEVGGKLYGNIITESPSGTLTNKGLISLPYNANLANGSSRARITRLVQTSTGILEIGLKTSATGGEYSQLITTNATFQDGSTIAVNVLGSSTDVALLAGETLNDIVESSGTLTIDGMLNITDNSALLDFNYVKDGKTIDLNVIQDKSIEEVVVTPTTTTVTEPTPTVTEPTVTEPTTTTTTPTTVTTPTAPTTVPTTPTVAEVDKSRKTDDNLVNIARALDVIREDNNKYTEMNPLIASLNTLATNEAVAVAVASTIAQTTTASVGVASQISTSIASILQKRQQVNIGSGLNSREPMLTSKNVWLKTYGSEGTQDNKDGINGFDMNAYGVAIGIDREYKENQSIGLAVFYTQANLEVNNALQESDMDVFTALVYGNVGIIDDKTNFLYQLGYAWQQTDTNRNLFTRQTAISSYTSTTVSLDLRVLRDVSISEKLLVQPMVSATYRHFDNPSYEETGAGANSLNISAFSSDELLLGVGALAEYKIDEKSKFIGNVNVAYDTIGDSTSFSSAFQGASAIAFDTNGIDNGEWQYTAGVGYERNVKEGHNINISYSYQAEGSAFSNNVISALYTYTF